MPASQHRVVVPRTIPLKDSGISHTTLNNDTNLNYSYQSRHTAAGFRKRTLNKLFAVVQIFPPKGKARRASMAKPGERQRFAYAGIYPHSAP
jgi:hypothetical protein